MSKAKTASKKIDTKLVREAFVRLDSANASLASIAAQVEEQTAAANGEAQAALRAIHDEMGTLEVTRKGAPSACRVVKLKGKYETVDGEELLIEGSETYQLRTAKPQKKIVI